MIKKLVRRAFRGMREEGMMETWKLAWQWVRGMLLYEPVTKLRPAAPVPAFDPAGRDPRIAVQIHVFYAELTEELMQAANRIPYRYDCYVSTDSEDKAEAIRRAFQGKSNANRVEVAVFPNRGRDLAPFVAQMSPHIRRYDYLCHLHTKHSVHDGFGRKWRRKMLDSLLATTGHVAAVLSLFENDAKLGMLFQRTFWRVKPSLGWKGNREGSEALFRRMRLEVPLPDRPQFPAGNMFWARTGAIAPVFECGLTMEDFPGELRQLDGTLAHCLERCWTAVAGAGGYTFRRVKAQPGVNRRGENG